MKHSLKKLIFGGLLAASGIAASVFWNAQNVGRELDAYRGVSIYDNGVLFFAATAKTTARTATILARSGNASNLSNAFIIKPKITGCRT